jgi:AcrR family transcriptional regulator
MAERKTRGDWIEAALKVLGGQGVDFVRVEPLAAAMGVTKGSFYWHFADRDALLAEMLEAWREEAGADFVPDAADASARLRLWLEWPRHDDGALEIAVRDWARRDARPAAALAAIDAARRAAIEAIFTELGFGADEAATRARLVYQALIGACALGAHAAGDTASLVALLTGRATPERKAAPRKREVEPDMPDLFG